MVVWIDNTTSFFFPESKGSLVSLGSVIPNTCRYFVAPSDGKTGRHEDTRLGGLIWTL